MSITSWERMTKGLVDDQSLGSLGDSQVQAIIDVLALVIHADKKVSPVEVAGFNHLLFDLPWLEDRHELIRDHVPGAAARASSVDKPDRGEELAKTAAKELEDEAIRERVFRMAASLAAVDMRVNADENEALRWVADAFEIDPDRRDEIIKSTRS